MCNFAWHSAACCCIFCRSERSGWTGKPRKQGPPHRHTCALLQQVRVYLFQVPVHFALSPPGEPPSARSQALVAGPPKEWSALCRGLLAVTAGFAQTSRETRHRQVLSGKRVGRKKRGSVTECSFVQVEAEVNRVRYMYTAWSFVISGRLMSLMKMAWRV